MTPGSRPAAGRGGGDPRPALCVAGLGLGTSDFQLAGGALLLFLANLVGIVLTGATVFLLLGFRPSRAARAAPQPDDPGGDRNPQDRPTGARGDRTRRGSRAPGL